MPVWQIANTAELPVTAAQMRKHCRIPDDVDDYLLMLYAAAAAKQISTDTRLAVNQVDLSTTLNAGTRSVPLPRGTFSNVVSLSVISDGETEELSTDGIGHDGGVPGVLTLGTDIPADKELQLTYRAGSDPLDPRITLAIFQLVAHWYEHRETATADGVPREIPLSYQTFVRSLDPMTDGVS